MQDEKLDNLDCTLDWTPPAPDNVSTSVSTTVSCLYNCTGHTLLHQDAYCPACYARDAAHDKLCAILSNSTSSLSISDVGNGSPNHFLDDEFVDSVVTDFFNSCERFNKGCDLNNHSVNIDHRLSPLTSSFHHSGNGTESTAAEMTNSSNTCANSTVLQTHLRGTERISEKPVRKKQREKRVGWEYKEGKRIRARARPWTPDEHRRFEESLELFGRNWVMCAAYIGTRRATLVRSHAQKHFIKLWKLNKPLPQKVKESGTGYTLSGKPLLADSISAKSYLIKLPCPQASDVPQ